MNIHPVEPKQRPSESSVPQPVPNLSYRIAKTIRYLFSLIKESAFTLSKKLVDYHWSPISYEEKRDAVQKLLESQLITGNQIAIGGKKVSYLFRARNQSTKKLDMHHFNKVISIDSINQIAHVEGMTTFGTLVEEALKQGFLPKVAPELIGITVGGAISGLGVESSSFKYGLFHRSVTEVEVLCGDGQIRVATRENEHRDLFYAMPNSYGTLGYILSCKIELVKAKPFVFLEYLKFHDLHEYFSAVKEHCQNKENFDFVDGAIFSKDLMVLVTGRFVDEAPKVSNYRPNGVYYKAIQMKNQDYLTTSDYIWRWDTDSFWSTEEPGFLQNPMFRKWVGPYLLRSDRLLRMSRFQEEFYENVVQPYVSPKDKPKVERLVQDVGIHIDRCAEFIEWFQEEIGIFPIFICPVEESYKNERYPLWDLHDGALSCNIGFYKSKETQYNPEEGHYNQLIEEKVYELGGKKALYSRCYFDEERFNELYDNENKYDALKSKYDPKGVFPTRYEKCVKNK